LSFETYHTVASGLLAIFVVTLLAAFVSFTLAIVVWRKPNRNRRLLVSFGLLVIASVAISVPQVVFKFVHFPTELTSENYESVRNQMDTETSVASRIMLSETAPSFSVTTDSGSSFVLSKCRGSVVLINFFRTDCGPCNLEMPVLQEIWKEYCEREDFRVIAISRGETMDAIHSFKSAHRLTFPLATDPDSSVYGLYASKGIPRTYLVARDGTLLFQSLGFMRSADYDGDEEQIREMVTKALASHE